MPLALQASGKIMAPVLATKLQDKRPGMQLAVVAFDGLLYVIDGISGGLVGGGAAGGG